MMPVPYYQVVEFLDWIKRNSNTNPQDMSIGSLREYAIAYLLRGDRQRERSMFDSLEITPAYVIQELLRIFQTCPMITETDIESKMTHFAECGQCIKYLAEHEIEPHQIPFHPLIRKFFSSQEYLMLQNSVHEVIMHHDHVLRGVRGNSNQELDQILKSLVKDCGDDLARFFLHFTSRGENQQLVHDYEISTTDIARSFRSGTRNTFGRDNFSHRDRDDGTFPIDLRDEDFNSEASRLAESVRLLIEGSFYEDQLRQNPQVLQDLLSLGIMESSSSQALEFIWWLQEKHPKLDILASFPANQLVELVTTFCEEKSYNNAASFSKEVMNWVQGEGQRSILQKLIDISRRLRHGRQASFSRISPFERYDTVPFHAIFLFLSAGNFPEFINQYWEDLNFLTGDHLDVYYSFEDLKRRISAYETLSEFRTLQVEATWLPAMVLWKENLAESCVVSFKQLSHSNIFEVVKIVVDRISKGNSIQEICEIANNFVQDTTDELLPGTKIILRNGEITMGDKYEVGQAGAVGPNSHAHDMTFSQIWNQNASNIDLNELGKELAVLRKQLKIEATEPEQDSAIGSVASAEVAAKNGDGAKSLEHLATAGKWVLDIALKLAIPVAIAALKSALGL